MEDQTPPPVKGYSWLLERRVRLLVKPQIQKKQCAFHPGHGILDQLDTLAGALEGAWEFAQSVCICFVDVEKAYDCDPQSF